MKILLTGSTGMVGKNILEHAGSHEYEFLAPPRAELNLLDYNATMNYLDKNKPDIIIHSAGKVGGIQANIKEPTAFLVENLDMGRNIVLAAKHSGIHKLLNLGSSCMYPRNSVEPLKEEQVLSGELEPTNEGYALAKIVTAKLCEYISREHECYQYKTIIPCNLYGRWDKFDEHFSHMIPAVIAKIHQAKIASDPFVEIWGDGKARREFMYAADLADFIFFAIPRFEELPEVLNIGLGFDYSILEYYQIIAEVVGYSGTFRHDLSKPTGMKRKLVDTTRVRGLGWAPKHSLRDGVKNAYMYYLQHLEANKL